MFHYKKCNFNYCSFFNFSFQIIMDGNIHLSKDQNATFKTNTFQQVQSMSSFDIEQTENQFEQTFDVAKFLKLKINPTEFTFLFFLLQV